MLNNPSSPQVTGAVHFDVNVADPVQLARRLTRTAPAHQPPVLLIDCRDVACLRTRGVGHFVALLLLIQRTGARLLLQNVGTPLAQLLRLLRLDDAFGVGRAARVSA
ncbi:STAS domain-containing protein [Hymenobacter sp. CRA2]|uniref:STAS domain-containing protein n=1 Tax=Hymenobacter sp. CRA2 TaxID=1955620 RepID=UPI00098FFA92|nr:STAS domain-containing protein [Hymenobacter sp. CRA2]OON68008.1 hypothetical protein B0919_15200 [Hymenobacter sp. CRA2]